MLGIFEKSGMPLHEFATNVGSVNETLKEEGLFTDSPKLKVLRLEWDYLNDVWFVKQIDIDLEVITKRSILSAIARIYDPCGFLAPITILGRMLLLLAWKASLSWDQLLPEDMQDE